MELIEYPAKMKEAATYSEDPRGCSEATTDSMPRKREREREREEREGWKRTLPQTRCQSDHTHVPEPGALVVGNTGFEAGRRWERASSVKQTSKGGTNKTLI
jgi:hypothetical protein